MSPDDLAKLWNNKKSTMNTYEWLHYIGLYHKIVPQDSNSLFKAASECLFGTQRYYQIVRKECVFYMKLTNNSLNLPIESSADEYAEKMKDDSSHGGFNEIALMSHFYRRDFIIVDSKEGPIFTYCNGFKCSIYLYYASELKHFDVLLPLENIEKASFCQSIVYELVCVRICKWKNFATGDRFSTEKTKSHYFINNKDNNTIKDEFNDNSYRANNKYQKSIVNSKIFSHKNANLRKPGFLKKFPLPHVIFKGLSPMIYKNIEYDSWIESKKEEDLFNFNNHPPLQVGMKCLCKIDSDQVEPFICYIQVMRDDGQCLVFIEELGEKRMVNINQMISLPVNEAKPWYPKKRPHLKYLNKSSNELTFSVDSKSNKLNLRQKKPHIVGLETKNIVLNKSKTFFKTENTVDLKKNDENNNFASETEIVSSSYAGLEWDSKINGTMNSIQCLEKYTREDYYTFNPQYVEYVTMPLTTETNGNIRENNSLNRQNSHFFTPPTVATTCNSPCVTYPQPINSAEQGNLTNLTYTNASTPNSTTSLPPPTNGANYMGNGSPNYPSYPYYYGPHGGFPSVRPTNLVPLNWRPLNTPIGVNFNIQRSMSPSGSDLPYNDVTTLRYFFNLGIEYMQNGGVILPQFSLPPPPMTPMGHPNNTYYPTTPNQLALEMQSLSVEDSANMQSPQNMAKENATKQNKYEYKGGRGGGHSRFRRNDAPNDRNGKNGSTFNRNHFNNGQRKNPRNGNFNNKPDSNEKKEHENESGLVESPSSTPNYPFISYPPPFYRPAYSFEPTPQFVPPVYQNFAYSSEDNSLHSEESGYMPPGGALPQQYMTYIPPPPPPFFYATPNGPSYYVNNNINTPTSVENQPPPKN